MYVVNNNNVTDVQFHTLKTWSYGRICKKINYFLHERDVIKRAVKRLLFLRFYCVKTRPDTRLPQSRAGGQGPYFRSVEHLGRSGIAKNPINAEKVKCDSKV